MDIKLHIDHGHFNKKKRNDLKQHILFLSFNSLDKPNGGCLNLFDK